MLLLSALLVGCGADDGGDDPTILVPSDLPTATGTGVAGAEPSATASGVPADDVDQVVSLTVAAGKVAGDTPRVDVKLGSRIRITVTADVADEVHVHGYDLTFATSPGTPVDVELVADKPGVYAVELHGARTELTRLQVS